jgi:hypothetical protein
MPTLHDGREVDSYSEEWKHETLARAVVAIKHVDQRRDWLAAFEKRHGAEAAEKLRATVRALWQRRVTTP